MKWIIWSGFPLTTFNIHYFTFGMRHPTTNSKRLSKIRSQMINWTVIKSSWLWCRNCLSVKSEFYFSKLKKAFKWLTCDMFYNFPTLHQIQNRKVFFRFQIEMSYKHPIDSQNPMNQFFSRYNHQFGWS